jgi:leader peptidase (prepilin peptidase)/N-methyltransferase
MVMLVFALIGLSIGSFLNVCIDRLPLKQSIISPPSHCPACHLKVAAFDLIPFFNYLWLRGRCRYCHGHIPIRIPVVELLTGLIFALLYWKFGLSRELGMSLVYASMLLVIFFIDLEHQLILNKIIYPSIVIAFAFSFLWPDLGVVNSLIGGAIGFGLLFLIILIYPAGMGEGDVKLALMMGLMNGYPGIFVALYIAVVTGGLVAVLLLVLRLKKRRQAVPFGPFLATAAMVTLIWGEEIWKHLGWF